jgi:acylphosphatase
VQGVFFRAHAQKKASKLGLTGFVRNLADGRVEVVIEGEEQPVKQMVAWCHLGPSEARVEGIEVQWEAFQGEFSNFQIQRG